MRAASSEVAQGTKQARPELAHLFRADDFDETSVKEWFSLREQSLDKLRPTLLASIKQVYDALNPDQREQLGALIESGPGLFFGGRACGGHRGRFAGPC